MKQGVTKPLPVLFIFSDELSLALSILQPHLNILCGLGYRHLLYAESAQHIDDNFRERLNVGDISIGFCNNSNDIDYTSHTATYAKRIDELTTKLNGGIICCLNTKYIDIVLLCRVYAIFYEIKKNIAVEEDKTYLMKIESKGHSGKAKLIPPDCYVITDKISSQDKKVYIVTQGREDEFLYPLFSDPYYRWILADFYFSYNPKSTKLHKDGYLPNTIYNFDREPIEATKIINKGSYATTKKGVNRNQQKFAIRRAKKGDQNIELLKKVRFFKSIIYTKDKEYILMEYAPGRNLDQLIPRLSYIQKLIVCLLLTVELKKIHQLCIIHRDLKPNNVRLKIHKGNIFDIELKIIDFNISVFLYKEKKKPTNLDADGYPHLSPEFRNKQSYDFTTDIYSLGYIFNTLGVTNDICNSMLDVAPSKRPTLDNVIYLFCNMLNNQVDLNLSTRNIIEETLASNELQENFAKLCINYESRALLHQYQRIKSSPLLKSTKHVDDSPSQEIDDLAFCICPCNFF